MPTLHISRKPIYWITFISLQISCLIICLEIMARLTAPHTALPPMSFGADYRRFEVQIARLDTYSQEYGTIDCIFIGSSLVEKGIQPAIFSQQYQNAFGESVNCFNMGLGSITMSTIGAIVPALINRYNPKIIIVGTQARAYNEDYLLTITNNPTHQAEHDLPTNFWVQHQAGNHNWQGVLWDHLYLYRFYLTFGAAFGAGYGGTTLQQEIHITEDGYQDLIGNNTDVTIAVNRNTPQDRDIGLLNFFADYSISENDLNAIYDLGHIDSTEIIIIEMPIHTSYTDFFIDGLDGYQTFINTLTEATQTTKIPLWRTTPFFNRTIPDEFWFDRYHLNEDGSPILTAWIANQVIHAIKNGKLPALHTLEPKT